MLLTLNEWSIAKTRVEEEIAVKIERKTTVSDPSRIAVMMENNKCKIHKIYLNQ
jgi:hypothetical protein